ncbi:MAG: hypothetical protein IKW76_03580 [Clostridia bacterium]|nr:hypothetical protein [Clostridia bacterium]
MQTANTIWGVLLPVINFLGIAAIGYWLTLRLLRVRKDTRFAVILPLTCARTASDSVYAMHLRLQWTHAGGQGVVIALDAGLSAPDRDEVERFCRTLKNVIFCTPEELAGVMKKL